ADEVRKRYVPGGQLLHVSFLGVDPLDRGLVAVLLHQRAAVPVERRDLIVVRLRARQYRYLLAEELDQLPEDATVRLPAESEEDEVVTPQDGIHHRGDDRILITHDSREQRLPRLDARDEILTQLELDGSLAVSGGAQSAKS